MLRPEQADRSRFPSTVLLHGSAVDFGLGQEAEIAIRLGAIYAAVLSFADEAEDGTDPPAAEQGHDHAGGGEKEDDVLVFAGRNVTFHALSFCDERHYGVSTPLA